MEISKIELNQKLFLKVIGFVISVWFACLIIPLFIFNDWQDRGTFGDTFGAVNALFSGFAFAGVILTILLQAKELSLQRQELEQTREELRGQKIQLEQQNINLSKQIFDNTFFNMLENLRSIVENMNSENQSLKGKAFLHNIAGSFQTKVRSKLIVSRVTKNTERKIVNSIIMKEYEPFFRVYSYNLGHYFRFLHNILKLIIQFSDSVEIRMKYASILQAQLSNDELGLIFYNSLSSYSLNKDGQPEFKNMLDDLNILENIDVRYVIIDCMADYFPKTDFFFRRKYLST